MRDPERIKVILDELGKVWEKYPDLRLGQLIINVDSNPYYTEDEDLIRNIKEYYEKIDKGICK